ncbi:putative proteinase inhibitor I13, potato inhibitor I [Rosa chinensis]|uniref:Proteinase inhibitor I13 n=1 Tax=Rosa chinensis TaxID=74649 RepID=A0A2P6RNK2_ROSCH|nr:putative proteinase inhibitor I13, potato inhibitor I [Rosa chinensis]
MSDPYPPCNSGAVPCPSQGAKYKQIWPELVGKPVQLAKTIIEKDNPFVTAEITKLGMGIIFNYCCNRVWIWEDNLGNVAEHYIPKIG